MSYVVLARKWRPRQFDEVVGQEHVARTLANAIEQDRVAHAFLFTGARGVGKTSTARILAKALNCEKGPTPVPCNECTACVEITSGQSVDVFEIDGASNRGINEIRELRDSVRYAPSRSKYKVYIIDEVHMLTTEAFNALLKTLEEPPPHVKFIFATTEPQKIPVTILSRCQRYDFKRIGQADIVRHLELLCGAEKIDADKAALQIIARQAAGGMRDALSLLDQIISFAGTRVTETEVNEILGVANRQHLFDLSEAILSHDAERALLVLDEVNRYGYDLPQFASELVSHFRDLMVISVVKSPDRVTDLTATEIEVAKQQISGAPTELLHRFFSLMVTGAQEMARSAYPKLILEMALVRLAQLEPLTGLDLLVDRLAALEAEFDGEPAPAVRATTPTARPAQAPVSRNADTPSPAPTAQSKPPVRTETSRAPASPNVAQEEGDDSDAEEDPAPVSLPPVNIPVVEPVVELAPVRAPESTSVAPAILFNDLPDRHAPPARLAEPDDFMEDDYDNDGVDEDEFGAAPYAESTQVVVAPAALSAPSLVAEPMEVPARLENVRLSIDQVPAAFAEEEERQVSSVEIKTLHPAELAAMSATERRNKLVEVVRLVSKAIAAVLEYAYVESFDHHRIELSLSDRLLGLLEDNHRTERLQEVVRRLFGDAWVLDLQTRDPVTGIQGTTIVEERDADRRERRRQLEQELRESTAVTQARELFNIPEDKIRVQVKLFDDF